MTIVDIMEHTRAELSFIGRCHIREQVTTIAHVIIVFLRLYMSPIGMMNSNPSAYPTWVNTGIRLTWNSGLIVRGANRGC